MFLENDAPRKHRPLRAVLPLIFSGLLHLALCVPAFLDPGLRGLFLAVLGIALLLAARNPFRSEAALAAVLLGDLGAVGLARLPLPVTLALGISAAFTAWLLGWSWREARRRSESRRLPLEALLAEAVDQHGQSLLQLSRQSPVLLVCLRHFGCTFCREALVRLAEERSAIEACGTHIVLVHQASPQDGASFLESYGLGHVHRVSDPMRWLYFHLGLKRGGPWQLLGPKVWYRAISARLLKRHGLGRVMGDARQMPGVFLIRDGVVLAAFVHRTAADNPDYRALAQCPS